MTEPQFTPGPWKTGECDSFIVWAERWRSTSWRQVPGHGGNGEGVTIADAEAPAWARVQCDGEMRRAWLAESQANANLIAAAPDLYEALDRMLKRYGAHSNGEIKQAADALAKARGEIEG